MSHQVLARKWRPRSFDALVGQDHVVRALTHALTTGRLHHAYLFTGTRGVGKTTIARILAKAVNCDAGMSASPCGQCSACTQIDQGGFVDYLELDAASNRGVDEMVHILDNAVYAPTAGRYKVYVIDEVHMLTAHAFNAMLKTLEEPPPHMLFILATTDPQKVPVTVLSRCMQLNLRNMQASAIAGHLADVLAKEKIQFEPTALELIGRAAGGSMRDALSLTDQAIAAGAGSVESAQVRDMLGMIDSEFVGRVLEALDQANGPALVGIADELADMPEAGARLLADLATRLGDMAASQHLSGSDASPTTGLPAWDAPTIQVFYQIVVYGQRDLPLAPDSRTGLMMTLLRMLAFSGAATDENDLPPTPTGQPEKTVGAAAARAALSASQPASRGSRKVTMPPPGSKSVPASVAPSSGEQAGRAPKSLSAMEKLVAGQRPARRSAASPPTISEAVSGDVSGIPEPLDMPPEPPPFDENPKPAPPGAGHQACQSGVNPGGKTDGGSAGRPRTATAVPSAFGDTQASPGLPERAPSGGRGAMPGFDGDWPGLARRVALSGRPGQFMMQSQLEKVADNQIFLRVPVEQLAERKLVLRVSEALKDYLPQVRLTVRVGNVDGGTAAVELESERIEQLERARASLEADPFVQTLLKDFDATILPDSVRAINGASLTHGDNT